MASKVLELFGQINLPEKNISWKQILQQQLCPFTSKKCFKVRKSQPDISIGTCTVRYGKDNKNIVICPNRFLERKQVFMDCIQLLSNHEPGNEFHVVPEVYIPGGSVDYFLVSVRNGKVKDFVAIEFQALDTTGTVWTEREFFLSDIRLIRNEDIIKSKKSFGMNWKMTAKTILVQLHHKIETFENIGKHLVLIIQDYLLEYLKKEFHFDHLRVPASLGDSMHIHSYGLTLLDENKFKLNLSSRLSTDSEGIATCLGLQAEARIELSVIIKNLENKISTDTLLTFY